MTRTFKAIALALFIFTLASASFGAGELDLSFLGNLGGTTGGRIYRIVPQADGKVIVGGNFRHAGGLGRNSLMRMNTDGTGDPTFRAPEFFQTTGFGSATIFAVAIQPDGKILVGGDFLGAGTTQARGIMRLNSDGSIDPTFTTPFTAGTSVRDIVVLEDGRLMVGGGFSQPAPDGTRINIARLNSNGSLDSIVYNDPAGTVFRMVVFPNGKIITGTSTRVFRYNADGTFDLAYVQATTDALDMLLMPDGRMLVATNGLVRLNPTGGTDFTFPSSSSDVIGLTPGPDGKVFVFGNFTAFGGIGRHRVALMNPDGTVDAAFATPTTPLGAVNDVAVLPFGRVIAGAVVTTQSPASAMALFDPNGSPVIPSIAAGGGGEGYSVLVQPDDKILVGGKFPFANGLGRPQIARFNADGSLDTGFTPPDLNGSFVLDVARQADGKILMAIAGNNVVNSRRLNANGTFDIQFPGTTEAHDVEQLADGTVLISGRSYVKKFNANGTLDASFQVFLGGAFPIEVQGMAVQPDGKIIIVGNFNNVNFVTRNNIARLNPNGSIDNTFVNANFADSTINTVAIQPDGKVLVGGTFLSLNGDTTKRFFGRLNSDGSLDAAFSPLFDAPVLGIDVQPDGKIVVGGAMGSINGVLRRRLARLNANGTLDTSFNTLEGVDSTVWGVDTQADGKVVYAGTFTTTNGITTLGVGRVLSAVVPVRTPFDYDGDSKSDVSVFRPSENKWYVFRSSDSVVSQVIFAIAGDVPVPADYDGDGKTDIAIFRPAAGDWWYLATSDGTQRSVHWGNNGDIARPSDFDGDGKADFIVFRPGENNWYRLGSTGVFSAVNFGSIGDKPVTGDFDGDGKSDPAIYRPSTGDWWWKSSNDGVQRATRFGISTDTPAAADYDGDGKTDFAVYRASTGVWYILNSGNGSTTIQAFGLSEDKPVAADYDGDGKADIAVFRPSSGVWYLLRSTAGFTAMQFGISTDTPTPNAYVP